MEEEEQKAGLGLGITVQPRWLLVWCCATVVGQTGQKVTLTCNYDTQQHGALHVCWGRGDVPLRGCDNLLVSTDGHKVTERVSSSFQLLGRLDQGDVSLTIQNLTTKDAGRYGCRVEIPGWANDEKRQFDLAVERDPTTSPTSEPEPITADQTHEGTSREAPADKLYIIFS
uniref:Ig-like domain-containing protein n=1 Tax=Nothobranchius furzeri TaxID=105023 RepID=A0A8C6L237_NOTFU